jgi:hypothetical protein
VQLESTLTCPSSGHKAVELMPADACQFFYHCKGGGAKLKPLPGDCCVFCSYGSVPCPPNEAIRRLLSIDHVSVPFDRRPLKTCALSWGKGAREACTRTTLLRYSGRAIN